MTMITPSYLGETIEYSSLHACRSTLEDPTTRDRTRRISVRILMLLSNRQWECGDSLDSRDVYACFQLLTDRSRRDHRDNI